MTAHIWGGFAPNWNANRRLLPHAGALAARCAPNLRYLAPRLPSAAPAPSASWQRSAPSRGRALHFLRSQRTKKPEIATPVKHDRAAPRAKTSSRSAAGQLWGWVRPDLKSNLGQLLGALLEISLSPVLVGGNGLGQMQNAVLVAVRHIALLGERTVAQGAVVSG